MAEQAILEVSLKDYKKQIDDLRGSLLNLESTSKEYQSTAEEIRTMQDKLNEVMGIGKEKADGVEGSYNQLSQTLSKLKKEWKTLEIGSERWTQLGQEIDSINEKLKEADASVGVFGRNVGNYQKSFEDAFKSVLPALGNISPELGKIGGAIGRVIPVIKSLTQVATAGLKGIKAAAASTGIGALVIAFGLLTNYITKNWDAISAWIKGVSKARAEHDAFKKSIEQTAKAHKDYIEYIKGTGASAMEVQVAELRYATDELKKQEAEYDKLKDMGRKMRKEAEEQAEEVGKAREEAHNQQEALNNALNSFITGQEKLSRQSGMTELEKELEETNRQFDDAIAGAKALAATMDDDSWLAAAIEKLERLRGEAQNRAKSKAGKGTWEKEADEIKELQKTIRDSTKTELELLDEKYAKELKMFRKHHKDTTELTTYYARERAKIELKAVQDMRASVMGVMSQLSSAFTGDLLAQSLKNAKDAAQDFYKALGVGEAPGSISEAMAGITDKQVEIAYNAGLIASKTKEELAAAWILVGENVKKAEKEQKAYNEAAIRAQKNIEKQQLANDERLAGLVENTDAYIQAEIDGTRALIDVQKDYISALEGVQDPTEEQIEQLTRAKIEMSGMTKELASQLQIQKQIGLERSIQTADNAAGKANMNTSTSGLWNSTNFDEGYQARITAAQVYYDAVKQMQYNSDAERIAAEQAAQEQLLEVQREYNEAKINNYMELASAIGDIFSSLGDLYEQDIANQVKNNKMGQKEAERQYKKVQALKISEATIQTIQCALAAFMGYQSLGQPWGGIMGAVAAAAVTAAGVAQIAKIKAQNPYSSSDVDSGSYTASVPMLQEYSPQAFTNLTNASDTQQLANALAENPIKAYCVESEVTAKQEIARQRNEESTF